MTTADSSGHVARLSFRRLRVQFALKSDEVFVKSSRYRSSSFVMARITAGFNSLNCDVRFLKEPIRCFDVRVPVIRETIDSDFVKRVKRGDTVVDQIWVLLYSYIYISTQIYLR